jgi:hypothetical protein
VGRRWICVAVLLSAPAIFADDAATIMAKVAANVEAASDARKQFVYRQTIRATMVGNGIRKENRQYLVVPSPTKTEKTLLAFHSEYRKGKQTSIYEDPVANHRPNVLDAELIQDLTDDLVDAKNSRDGIPRGLFPLRSAALPGYSFTMKGESEREGRRVYQIAFEPAAKNDVCVHIGKDEDDDCDTEPWAGEVWIDAAELQPVRIDTHLAPKVPWADRTFLGTNLKQLGFAITYKRVAEGVWFPATYGTEFQIDVLFFYRRTITLNLESSGFQKTDATSTIQYDLAAVPVP